MDLPFEAETKMGQMTEARIIQNQADSTGSTCDFVLFSRFVFDYISCLAELRYLARLRPYPSSRLTLYVDARVQWETACFSRFGTSKCIVNTI